MPSRTACRMSEPMLGVSGNRSALDPISTNGTPERLKSSILSDTGLMIAPSTRACRRARRWLSSRPCTQSDEKTRSEAPCSAT